jgi:hypothetical protein
MYRVNKVSQTEIHTAQPLVLESSAFEVQMVVAKMKRHNSPAIDQISM